MHQRYITLSEQEVVDALNSHAEQAISEVQRELDFTPHHSRAYALSLYRAATLSSPLIPSVVVARSNTGKPLRILDRNNCPPGFSNLYSRWSNLVLLIQQLQPHDKNNLRRAICGQPLVSYYHSVPASLIDIAIALIEMGDWINGLRNPFRSRQPYMSSTLPPDFGATFPTPSVLRASRSQTSIPGNVSAELHEPSPQPYPDTHYSYPHSPSPPNIFPDSSHTEAFTPAVGGFLTPHPINVSMPSPTGVDHPQIPPRFPVPEPPTTIGSARVQHQYQPPGNPVSATEYGDSEARDPAPTELERNLSGSSHESNKESRRYCANDKVDFSEDQADKFTNNIADVISSNSSISQIIMQLGRHGCQDLSRELNPDSCSPVAEKRGGYSDVYFGHLYDGTPVAIKTIFSCGTKNDEEIKHLKRTARELYTWLKCKHPHIAPLLGLAEYKGQIAMISRWMHHGHVRAYVNKHPDANRLSLCIGTAAALRYLHRNQVIHGDLKGPNILVSDEGNAVLIDFGNASLGGDTTLEFTATATNSSITLRWTAPEMFEESKHTMQGDIYSLGMTILEIFSGKQPYPDKQEKAAMFAIMAGRTPERPDRIPVGESWADELWKLLQECWDTDPMQRPTASDVHTRLKTIQRRRVSAPLWSGSSDK
ncbi:mitogen activated protein kinase kinase kinase [Ceratobasidium sp. AG-Ba]|nr:mitogen activated protein kinase kinase kinase [Ceratobasidium sp. AG-Ba]